MIVNELKKIGIECTFAPIKLKPVQHLHIYYRVLVKILFLFYFLSLLERWKRRNLHTKSQSLKCLLKLMRLNLFRRLEVFLLIQTQKLHLKMILKILLMKLALIKRSKYKSSYISEEKMVIESKIDPKEWILECERAASKLKI